MTRGRAVTSVISALSLLWATAAVAAILPVPQGPSARNETPALPLDTRKPQPKPMPAPAPSDHLATPEENLLSWKL